MSSGCTSGLRYIMPNPNPTHQRGSMPRRSISSPRYFPTLADMHRFAMSISIATPLSRRANSTPGMERMRSITSTQSKVDAQCTRFLP